LPAGGCRNRDNPNYGGRPEKESTVLRDPARKRKTMTKGDERNTRPDGERIVEHSILGPGAERKRGNPEKRRCEMRTVARRGLAGWGDGETVKMVVGG
jgi:hypothetical protein